LAETVYTIDRIPELSQKAQQILQLLGYKNIQFLVSDGSVGWPEFAPYDRIIVTAARRIFPNRLLTSSKKAARSLSLGIKFWARPDNREKHKGEIKLFDCGKCVFVPLIGEFGWPNKKENE